MTIMAIAYSLPAKLYFAGSETCKVHFALAKNILYMFNRCCILLGPAMAVPRLDPRYPALSISSSLKRVREFLSAFGGFLRIAAQNQRFTSKKCH
jgi:hypothetical protein